MFTTFFCFLLYFPFLHAAFLLLVVVFWGFGFGWGFFYFATRSALFSQAGLVEIPNLPAEGKAWDIQDEHCEKPLPKEGDAALGQHTDVLGVLTPWEVSRVDQWFPGCVTDTAINQLLRSSKPEPVEQQDCSPCVKGHCCTRVMGNANKPGEACRALPGKEQGVARLLVLSKLALHYILITRTWHGVYTVTICRAAREKGRSCEAFQGCVQLIQSWQTDAKPMSRSMWRCCWLLARRTSH